MAHFSDDKLEKGKCLEFCTPEGQEDFFNYCNRPRRNIIEVLDDFCKTTPKLTLQSLFEIFTPIKPRSFSIASSCAASENQSIEILVAVVKYFTKMKKERLGLCSNWLKNLKPDDTLYGWITNGTFIFPSDNTPIIMIGPGTGLAPFRNLILEKNHFGEAFKDNMILFFGCRNKTGDFHSKEILEQLDFDGKLTLICAFSRDQENKVYVQHKIEEYNALVWEVISNKKGIICIAGNAKNMPNNVKESIVENVLMKKGKMSQENAKAFIENMESNGRLQMETW